MTGVLHILPNPVTRTCLNHKNNEDKIKIPVLNTGIDAHRQGLAAPNIPAVGGAAAALHHRLVTPAQQKKKKKQSKASDTQNK